MDNRKKKPSWLKIRFVENEKSREISSLMDSLALHSVCQSAHCPNRMECWSAGVATFMILGVLCTRNCRFCAVDTSANPPPPDPNEPKNLANAVKRLGLKYLVITSVTRDDLPDGGATHFAKCIKAVRRENPKTIIEALIPDLNLKDSSLKIISESAPDVLSHNIETVKRLTPLVRDRKAGYSKSIRLLSMMKDLNQDMVLKSGVMLGMGEERKEVMESMQDLHSAGVEILTMGQYLQPSANHIAIERYVAPEEFEAYRLKGYDFGFKYIASGPSVRSSYKASKPFIKGFLKAGMSKR